MAGLRVRGACRVAYFVEFVEPVLHYLDHVDGLTDQARKAIVDGVIQELGKDADRFLALYPLTHESLCFWYDYPYPHEGQVYDFNFVVDGSHMPMGVVRIVYIECSTLPVE
jgi:hypothetical protein